MTDREKFLGRWSRKKVQAQRAPADAPEAATDTPEPAADAAKSEQAAAPDRQTGASLKPQSPAAPKPEFDLASLPSLESITAATDIRAFLAPGVPAELTRAALRRAWLADPTIRDFVGLAENSWDFTDPSAMPGFGDIPPGYDIKKMVAQIFGETDEAQRKPEEPATPETAKLAPAEPQGTANAEESPPADANAGAAAAPELSDFGRPAGLPSTAKASPEPSQADLVQRNNNIATQNSIAEAPPKETKHRRQHGGALPQS